jgi:hypothetical protein
MKQHSEWIILGAFVAVIIAIVFVAIFAGVEATETTGLRYIGALLGGALIGKKWLGNGNEKEEEPAPPKKPVPSTKKRKRT